MTGNPEQLLAALERIRHVLEEIDRGAGFLEDRGFGWSIDLERRAGIDDVRALFASKPELLLLLPRLGRLLEDRARVIGLTSIPHDEVKAAINQIERDSGENAKA